MASVPETQTHKGLPPDYYDWGLKHNFFQWLWHTWKYKQVQQVLLQVMSLNRILDFGSASGTAINKITKDFKDLEIHAVDVIDELIEYGKSKRPHILFKKIDGVHLPYPDEYFDVVTALDVLEHVSNLDNVLLEILRCLKKGGKLIITIPNENFLWEIIWGIWTVGKGKVWEDAHINSFGLVSFAAYLKEKGFNIDKKTRTHLRLNNFIVASKI